VNASSVQRLFETVVEGGYCVGCGACAAVEDAPITVELDGYGRYMARLDPRADGAGPRFAVDAVCPFGDAASNEDDLGAERFEGIGPSKPERDDRVGFFRAIWAGWVAEEDFRSRGSSGGMATWILERLLRSGRIDAVLHVRANEGREGPLFSFAISETVDATRSGAKSRYYPVEMSEVLRHVREREGRYAIVGIPCFIKAVRLLARQDPRIRDRVRYTVGIVCGHGKSDRFAGLFSWQSGIHPSDIRSIDFRRKLDGRPANHYGVEIVGHRGGREVTVVRPTRDHFGFLWSQGFFKLGACDYCDDVFAETADVTVGDAWLPAYVNDSRGTNVVVARHPDLVELIESGVRSGALRLEPLSAEDAAASQAGGLRHRRDGLRYRLWLADREGTWRPKKRVEPQRDHLNRRQRRTYRLRAWLSAQSHVEFDAALDAGDFERFRRSMAPKVDYFELMTSRRPIRAFARILWRSLSPRKRS